MREPQPQRDLRLAADYLVRRWRREGFPKSLHEGLSQAETYEIDGAPLTAHEARDAVSLALDLYNPQEEV